MRTHTSYNLSNVKCHRCRIVIPKNVICAKSFTGGMTPASYHIICLIETLKEDIVTWKKYMIENAGHRGKQKVSF